MKNMKVSILRIAVVLASLSIVFLCATWLPATAENLAITAPEFKHLQLPLLLGIYTTAVPYFIAVFNVFKLLKLIEKDSVFKISSINYLNIIKKCCIAEIGLYFLGFMYLSANDAGNPVMGLLVLAIMFTAFVIYTFIEILKELLIKAVEMKNENDLTV